MKRLVGGVPVLLLATLALGCSDKGPIREPAELVKVESPALKPRVLWDESPGNGNDELHTRLRLAVESDVAVTADVEGNVYALSPRDGKKLWAAETKARVIAGPFVAADLVLVGTLDAEVIALKRADGSLVWRAPVSSEVMAPPVSDGRIVVVRCGDGKIFGLNAGSGARIWSFDRAVPPLTLRGLSAPLLSGGAVYVGLDNGRIVALRLDTGETLWEEVVAAPAGRSELERIVDVDADPIVTNDGVYAVSFGGELAAISLEDGRVAWRRPVKSYSGVAIAGTLISVTDEDGVVWGLDAQSGAAAWKQEGLKYRRLSPPVVVDGYIVVADFEGYVHWLASQDGRIVARVRAVDDPVSAPMVSHDDLLYVLADDGEIAAVGVQATD
ncbi:MAG TPA: outer membrane protein assembly factor BamB [Verrucomicrobiae bacterium]|nr:outer membrane protein assembly factor BamB [Verrucomicrobiae bacterium]